MITIGQKGKLGKEVLTVISFNEKTFTCDNGKSYIIQYSKWMTEGAIIENVKPKRTKRFKACPEGFYDKEMTKEEEERIEEYMQNSKYRQAGSSLRR